MDERLWNLLEKEGSSCLKELKEQFLTPLHLRFAVDFHWFNS